MTLVVLLHGDIAPCFAEELDLGMSARLIADKESWLHAITTCPSDSDCARNSYLQACRCRVGCPAPHGSWSDTWNQSHPDNLRKECNLFQESVYGAILYVFWVVLFITNITVFTILVIPNIIAILIYLLLRAAEAKNAKNVHKILKKNAKKVLTIIRC